jgi:hypothetical protein
LRIVLHICFKAVLWTAFLFHLTGDIGTGLNKTISDLNWHHLVVTYDGSSFKFYVDGVLSGSTNMPGSLASSLATYIIGNGYWKGAIDDLRFYSRTLTASDVPPYCYGLFALLTN